MAGRRIEEGNGTEARWDKEEAKGEERGTYLS